MCIIIDANLASEIFRDTLNENYVPIIYWLFSRDGIMIHGGKLSVELFRIGCASRSIKVLQQAGHAINIDNTTVGLEEQNINNLNICVSDDPHIIALARVSGARTLCSHDNDLHVDFKNKNLIDKPRGSIYQDRNHSILLRHTPGCQHRR